MKIYLKLFILLLYSSSIFAQVKDIAKKGINSTVTVIALDEQLEPMKFGSGFVFEKDKVATNFHVIEGCTSILILTNIDTIRYLSNELLGMDIDNDLVVIKIQSIPVEPVVLSLDSVLEIGDEIYVVGNPKGLRGTFSEGIISSIRNFNNRRLIQISAPISNGSSGGPVLNTKGEVIAISVSTIAEGQNLNFAVPVEFLKKISTQNHNSILLGTVINIEKDSDLTDSEIVFIDSTTSPDYYGKAMFLKSKLNREEKDSLKNNGFQLSQRLINDYEEVLFYFTKAIDIDPQCSNCFLFRAWTKFSFDDFYGAFNDFYGAFNVAKTDIDRQLECLGYMNGHPFLQHSFVLNKMDSLILQNPDYSYYKARAGFKKDSYDFESALIDYNFLMKNYNYSDDDILWNIAYCNSQIGDNINAIMYFTKYIESKKMLKEVDTYLDNTYMFRGDCKMGLSDYRGALLDYKKALQLIQINDLDPFPSKSLIYNCMANAKISLNDFVGALADLNKALVLYKGNHFSIDYNGRIEKDPEKGQSYFLRGIAKFNLLDKNGACIDWSLSGENGISEAYDKISEYCK